MELLFSEENLIISQYTVTTSHNSQHNTASWPGVFSVQLLEEMYNVHRFMYIVDAVAS